MSRIAAIFILTGALVLMSLGHVLTKLALSDVAPLTLVWVSVAIGMVVLSLYTFVIRGERIPKGLGKQVWYYIIAIGLLNFAIGRIFMTLSLDRLPATTNIYLVNFIGFITME